MQLSHISMYISENKQSYVYRTIIDTCCILLVPCPMLWCYHQQECRVVALLLVLLLVPPIIVLLWYYKKYKPQAPIQVEFFTISGGGHDHGMLTNTFIQIHMLHMLRNCVCGYLPFPGLISPWFHASQSSCFLRATSNGCRNWMWIARAWDWSCKPAWRTRSAPEPNDDVS